MNDHHLLTEKVLHKGNEIKVHQEESATLFGIEDTSSDLSQDHSVLLEDDDVREPEHENDDDGEMPLVMNDDGGAPLLLVVQQSRLLSPIEYIIQRHTSIYTMPLECCCYQQQEMDQHPPPRGGSSSIIWPSCVTLYYFLLLTS